MRVMTISCKTLKEMDLTSQLANAHAISIIEWYVYAEPDAVCTGKVGEEVMKHLQALAYSFFVLRLRDSNELHRRPDLAFCDHSYLAKQPAGTLLL